MDSSSNHLAVHYFATVRTRHWVSEEVFLSPEFLILKLYAAIGNVGIDFVPSRYPSVGAFGPMELPAAFIEGRGAGIDGIMKFLRSVVDIDQLHADQISDPNEERESLSVAATRTLSQSIQYTLFGSQEVFVKFTKPVIFDSMQSRIAAEFFLSHKRTQWINRDHRIIESDLVQLLRHISSKLFRSNDKFLFSNSAPSVCDMIVYAHLSVLFSISEPYTPFACLRDNEEMEEILQRLKGFLLDFDDWCWARKARLAELEQSPIPTADLAARGNQIVVEAVQADEEDPKHVTRPLLGKDPETRNRNMIFLAFAATAVAAVGYGPVVLSR
jgi:hypothetical protein